MLCPRHGHTRRGFTLARDDSFLILNTSYVLVTSQPTNQKVYTFRSAIVTSWASLGPETCLPSRPSRFTAMAERLHSRAGTWVHVVNRVGRIRQVPLRSWGCPYQRCHKDTHFLRSSKNILYSDGSALNFWDRAKAR